MKGSIQKRNDKWFLTVSMGFDTSGKRIRKTRTVEAEDYEDAVVKLNDFITEIERGTSLDASKMTFEEYLLLWLKDYAEKNLRPKTLACYKQFIQKRIIPGLGHIKLQSLTPIQLMSFYNNLSEAGIREDKIKIDGKMTKNPGILSASTISKYHRVISSALQDAVQWQLILSNPCERVKPPKVAKKKSAHYEIDTVKNLFKKLESEPIRYRVMVMLAIVTGMRRGEIMALEWKDINKNKVTVDKSMYYVKGNLAIDKTKTESSNRTVHIPQFMIELLDQYKAWQLEDKTKCAEFWQNKNEKSDYLFTTPTGKLMHIDTISSWFADFVKRTGLPKLTFHGLRHSAASILLDNGLNLKALSEILGHAEGITTINIYSHKLKTADQQAADIMDKVLGKKRTIGKRAK